MVYYIYYYFLFNFFLEHFIYGLTGEYYLLNNQICKSENSKAIMPDIEESGTIKTKRIDQTINFAINETNEAWFGVSTLLSDYFGVIWIGDIYLECSGEWFFAINVYYLFYIIKIE